MCEEDWKMMYLPKVCLQRVTWFVFQADCFSSVDDVTYLSKVMQYLHPMDS